MNATIRYHVSQLTDIGEDPVNLQALCSRTRSPSYRCLDALSLFPDLT
jgi:hypothetical protein